MFSNPITPTGFTKPVNDYFRVATASPEVVLGDVATNVVTTLKAYEEAGKAQVELLVLPELSITGYSTADLFQNSHVLEETEKGLIALARATTDGPALLVGAPIRHQGRLYNCAVMLANGRIRGIIPKVRLANYREFYEKRWFSTGRNIMDEAVEIGERQIPFGVNIMFNINNTLVGAEICEDMFAATSPATTTALAGAHLIANLSASNELIGKAAWRKTLISSFTGRTMSAYAYTSAGRGESVADVIYGAHQLISENGRIQTEKEPFSEDTTPLVYDIDRTYLEHDRLVNQTWADEAGEVQEDNDYTVIHIGVAKPSDGKLLRYVDAHPYVPQTTTALNARCAELFSDMAHSLAQRIQDANAQSIVIGLSGGLDSTLALLTAVETCKILGVPNSFIHTVTMPAEASSERTQDNATELANALGTTHKIIPVADLSNTLLASIGHNTTDEDVTFQNVQARMRTTVLMNYANFAHGFVVGTGDMSEIAKGWNTFNGDHMSMFNPNNNVPKTLVSFLVKWFAETEADDTAAKVLFDILDTPISPELTGKGDISQETEDLIGPYDLSDFFMFEHLRYGSRPNKIGFLATEVFKDAYTPEEIAKWLTLFLRMHTGSQWKRNVATDGPKIGSTALSPRGDLRMAPNMGPEWFLEGNWDANK